MTDAARMRPELRRAFRDTDDAVLGGVAAGLAQHLGLEARHVRVGFVALALLSGFGVVVYAALWALLPVGPIELSDIAPGLESAERRGMRTTSRPAAARNVGLAASVGLVGLGVVIALQHAGLWVGPRIFWPILVAGAGLALLWWQADDQARAEWISPVASWRSLVRVLAAVILIAGAVWLALFQANVDDIGTIGLAIGLALLGFALAVGPWLLRLSRDLQRERGERIRSEERADLAAHLHDSVLQTLALIQRKADDPQAVSALARTQERELRSWLFDPANADGATLKAALQQMVAEVEQAHETRVELVVVGDTATDDKIAALVAAAREALVNAAKHSGADQIDVYAEVEPERVEIDVRDRGRGFDLGDVGADRRGISGSIVERMTRHGGEAEVTTAVDSGTEVRMWMPLASADTSNQGQQDS